MVISNDFDIIRHNMMYRIKMDINLIIQYNIYEFMTTVVFWGKIQY